MKWSRMVTYGAQVYYQETEQDASQSGYDPMRRIARFWTTLSLWDKPGLCIYLRCPHYMLIYSLIAFRITFVSPVISLRSQCKLDQSSVVMCSRQRSLPTLVDPTPKVKCPDMQRGCVGWAQRHQAACSDQMGEYYETYGKSPETCTLLHHRPNLKMSTERRGSHG